MAQPLSSSTPASWTSTASFFMGGSLDQKRDVVSCGPPRLHQVKPTKLGEAPHPHGGHDDRADPADQDRRDGTEQGGEQTRLELSQLVRGAGGQRVRGANAAAHPVGRSNQQQ